MVSGDPGQVVMNLGLFDGGALDRDRPKPIEMHWLIFKKAFIQSQVPWPSILNRAVLVAFAAQIRKGLYTRPGVSIWPPWKLKFRDRAWIGGRSTILNLVAIEIGISSPLTPEVFLAATGHDIRSRTFEYANRLILIESGGWVGTREHVGPRVTLHDYFVVAAGSTALNDVVALDVVVGAPARVISKHEFRSATS